MSDVLLSSLNNARVVPRHSGVSVISETAEHALASPPTPTILQTEPKIQISDSIEGRGFGVTSETSARSLVVPIVFWLLSLFQEQNSILSRPTVVSFCGARVGECLLDCSR